ncbi:NUDIX domain-containing protein [Streptomyces sp. NBC_01264]|uniref:NUDIX domain-containing protein n=1 Tax=Streptomyces sp. NBC_01264 TaxID=2903804 RepID=UPI002258293B|nr:NUDIX hydrolase [Streptomyces sp. NBC_01264]MCX4782803.1 NUDIX hydrolase [Streptomyces sp. NBC_01264]
MSAEAGEPTERAVPRPHAVVGVGVIVVGHDGRVLLGQAHDGRWELPGGKVDPGEGFEQAAARELAEETALRVAPEEIRIVSIMLAGSSGTDSDSDSDSGARSGPTRLTAAAFTSAAEGSATVTEPHKIARWSWFAPAEIPAALYAPSAAALRAWRPDLATQLPPVPSYDYPTTASPDPAGGPGPR